jgi:uncharacterized protein YciU (UPF0263 family)
MDVMGHDVKDVAEMILFGLQENDKVASAEILAMGDNPARAVIAIETDTGQEFFAEVIPA